MTIAVAVMERIFRYNGVKLADPGGGMTPEQVATFYAASGAYPQLTNATVIDEGVNADGTQHTYSFQKLVGTKG